MSVPPAIDTGGRASVRPGTGPKRAITVDAPKPLYALEADDFAAAVLEGAPPAASEADSIGNMAVLENMLRQL